METPDAEGAPPAGAKDGEFQRVARLSQLPPDGGRCTVVVGSGVEVALFRTGETVFAVANRCPHRGAPLAAGWLENGLIACALHGWRFDLATGQGIDRPDCPLPTYRVRVVDDEIWLHPLAVNPSDRRTEESEL